MDLKQKSHIRKQPNNVNKAPNLYCILNLGYMTNYGDEIPLSGYNPLNC